MKPLNDLIWTDETDDEIMTLALDDKPMAQICAVSESACSNTPGTSGGDQTYYHGVRLMGDFLGCGC